MEHAIQLNFADPVSRIMVRDLRLDSLPILGRFLPTKSHEVVDQLPTFESSAAADFNC